jgi:[acyl-carrier-protein] S-malonyltransferase
MGRDLFDGCEPARRLFERADEALGYSLSRLCFEGPDEALRETERAQPAIFTVSLACLEAARTLGGLPSNDAPAFVAGHSLGEYTALVAGGALEFEDGLRLVQKRGRLMQQAAEANPGTMAAILGLDGEAIEEICRTTGASPCNYNAPGQIVIGGTSAAVEQALMLAIERGAQRGIKLNVSGAFHTSLMAPAAGGMAQAVAGVPVHEPSVPLIANTTGEPLTAVDELRHELIEQLTAPVLWQRSVERMIAGGARHFIEFGPGRVLGGLIRRIDRSASVANVSDMATAGKLAPAAAPP